MQTGIYKLTFPDSFYIGSAAISFRLRKRIHLSSLQAGTHTSTNIVNKYAEYGLPKFEIIEKCKPENCSSREQHWILELKPSLNMTANTNSRLGAKLSNETKDKLRKSKVGKSLSAKHRASIAASGIGRKHSEETKAKIRKGNLNKFVSKETGAKISKSKTGQKYGPQSEEHKRNRINSLKATCAAKKAKPFLS